LGEFLSPTRKQQAESQGIQGYLKAVFSCRYQTGSKACIHFYSLSGELIIPQLLFCPKEDGFEVKHSGMPKSFPILKLWEKELQKIRGKCGRCVYSGGNE